MSTKSKQIIDQDFMAIDELILHTENPENNQFRHTTTPFLYEPVDEQIHLFIPLDLIENDPPAWYQDLQDISKCLVELAGVKIPAVLAFNEAINMEDYLDQIDDKYEPDEISRFFPKNKAQLIKLDLQQSPLLDSNTQFEQ